MAEGANRKFAAVGLIVGLVAVLIVAAIAYSVVSGAMGDGKAVVAGSGAASGQSSSDGASGWNATAVGSIAVADSEGYDITLGDIGRGKPMVVNVWATWCPFCIDEMQDFQRLYETYGEKVQFVMLNRADSSSELSKAHEYIDKNGFTFPVYFDTHSEVAKYFTVHSLPTTIVIDSGGSVLSNKPGQIKPDVFGEALAELS